MISGPIFLMTVESGTPETVVGLHINLPDRRIDTMVCFLIQMASSGPHNQVFDHCIVMGFLDLRQLFGPLFPAALLLDLVEIGSEVVRPFVQGGIHLVQISQIALSSVRGAMRAARLNTASSFSTVFRLSGSSFAAICSARLRTSGEWTFS